MNTLIKELEEEKKYLKDRVDLIEKTIENLQNLCDHKLDDGSDAYEYEGHDSHYDYHKCSKCGDVDKI